MKRRPSQAAARGQLAALRKLHGRAPALVDVRAADEQWRRDNPAKAAAFDAEKRRQLALLSSRKT